MRRGWRRCSVALVVLAVVAAACGSSSKTTSTSATTAGGSSGSGGGSAEFKAQTADEVTSQLEKLTGGIKPVSGNTTRGVTPTEITVESVTALKTAQGIEPFPGMCQGAQARFEHANRSGGVNGRKIKWAGCRDDGSDRARNQQLMQQAVEQDKAFAVLPVTSQGFFSEDYLNKNHVPYFGFGFQPGYCGYNHPFAFGNTLTVCPPDALPGNAISTPGQYVALGKAIGKKDLSGLKAVAVYEDTPSSKAGIPIVNRSLQQAGASLVGTVSNLPGPPAPPVTDFTSYVQDVTAKSPDVVVLITGPENQLGMTGALKAAGFKGTIAGYNYSDSRIFLAPQLIDTLDGTYQINVGIGSSVFGGSTFDGIRKDLDDAGFKDVPLSGGVLIGYSAADMFLDALSKVKEPLTAESFVNTVNGGYHYPGLGNAVCESYWPMTHFGGPFCYSIVKIEKGKKDFTPAADLDKYPFALVKTS